MSYLKNYVLIFSLLLLSSCRIIGYHDGYNQLSRQNQNKVEKTSAPIGELACDNKIYVVSEEQISNYLEQCDSAIVFRWIPYCPYTITPQEFEQFCDENNYKPVIVQTCYCRQSFTLFNAVHTPLLFPDIEKYGTKTVYKYIEKFQVALTGDLKPEYAFWVFNKGKFNRYMRDEEIKKCCSIKKGKPFFKIKSSLKFNKNRI